MDDATKILLNQIGMIIFGALMSFVAAVYWWKRNTAVRLAAAIAEDHQLVLGRLQDLETKLALVNQAVVPISTAFQAILIKELTHFHTPEMDALMVKIGPPNTLTEEDAARLAVLLKERTEDMGDEITASERGAASILPEVMKRAIIEQTVLQNEELLRLKVVTVASLVGVVTGIKEE